MIYSWAEDFVASHGVSAERAGNELARLQREKGDLSPQVVVEAARSGVCPLHRLFEWDDELAAERYRFDQASTVVRSVMVQIDDDTRMESRFVCAFVRGGRSAPGASRPVSVRVGAPQKKVPSLETRLEHAWAALLRWRDEYGDIEDFAVLVESIDRIRAAAESAA